VSLCAIEDGIHDLNLSQPKSRQQMFNALQQWLASLRLAEPKSESVT
jgi:hypothetical protein